jgi:hypothetical protein
LLAASAVIPNFHRRPRAKTVAETPVAFWAWRKQAPSQADVQQAIEKTKTRAIFLRAGQIDLQDGSLRRIRPTSGPFPQEVDLHLVYNATRTLLARLEQVDESALADAISAAYHADVERAQHEHARVLGVQIDIDFPTSLLRRYEKTLSLLRTRLEPGAQISITGLPTWMQSSDLRGTLSQVDFWIPQLYGAEVPQRFDQTIPISSVETVSRFVNQARELDKPFYAGLAAYSWALLYSSNGSLISLRGDMDPEAIAADQNLELIDQRPFSGSTNGGIVASEWRYVYRARADGVTEELAMHRGDVLVLDVPSAESLRLAARAVRESAGEKLLGICVFRLPAVEDPATLNLAQVASALADFESAAKVEIRIYPDAQIVAGSSSSPANWIVEVKNSGAASAINGTIKIDLQTSTGEIESLTPPGLAALEYLCARNTNLSALDPCSQRRANVIRLRLRTLMAGQTLTARLAMKPPTKVIPVLIEMQTDTGQTYQERREVNVESRVKQ